MGLRAVARGVAEAVRGLHLFVDRRAFRPEVRLATINDHTTEANLEAALAALEGYAGPAWWQSTLSLLSPAEGGEGRAPYRVYREVPLGPAVPH